MTNQIIGLIGGRKVLPRISPSVWAWTNAQLFGDVIIKIICLLYSSPGSLSCGLSPSKALNQPSVWANAGIFQATLESMFLGYFSGTQTGDKSILSYVMQVLKQAEALTSSKCAVTHWKMTSWMHKPFCVGALCSGKSLCFWSDVKAMITTLHNTHLWP